MGITSFKSTTPSSESTSLCTGDDVTMVDECKQSTTPSSIHVKESVQVNTFHDGLKAWMDFLNITVYVQKVIWSMHIQPIKRNYDNPIGESPWRSWRYQVCIITRGLCSCNVRLFNDDITAVGVSYWRRREFQTYARLHRGRMHLNTLRPRQNIPHFADDIFKCILLNENLWISIKISLNGEINNMAALVQIMAWRRSDHKPLSEPMMFSLMPHICGIRPQWNRL